MLSQKLNVKLIDFEAKVDKSGKKPYARFKTDSGWYSAFEADVIDELKKCIGRTISVNVAVSDQGFKNIKSFNGIVRDEFAGANVVSSSDNPIETIEVKPDQRSTTMYVSYVKDLICIGKTFEEAVIIIKKAQKEFS